MLPSATDLDPVVLVSVSGMAEVMGITRHALHMRLSRSHPSLPPPDRKLEGCMVWFATTELASTLGVTETRLIEVASP